MGSTPAARRPTYVWAQNTSHAFVTVSLNKDERQQTPRVSFGTRRLRVQLAADDGIGAGGTGAEGGVDLELETYKQLVPDACGWQSTNRGVLLRLRKRTERHWPRLLKGITPDGKQGVDWGRFDHPDVEVAERRANGRALFDERSAAREADMRTLRPQFEQYLSRFRASQEVGEMLESSEQSEMLRLGEAILKHFREERTERAALLGDAPLPAGVDEEKLERALVKLRELERRGQLAYDRNTPSWQEWRRRAAERRTSVGLDPVTGQPTEARSSKKGKARAGRKPKAKQRPLPNQHTL